MNLKSRMLSASFSEKYDVTKGNKYIHPLKQLIIAKNEIAFLFFHISRAVSHKQTQKIIVNTTYINKTVYDRVEL